MSDYWYFVILAVFCGSGCINTPEPYVLPDSEAISAEEIYSFPTYTEGAVFDSEGNIFVSELPGGVIHKIAPDGSKETWSKNVREPNGHIILPDGTHLVCDNAAKTVVHLTATGEVIKTIAQVNGDSLRTPNDLVVDYDYGVLFHRFWYLA